MKVYQVQVYYWDDGDHVVKDYFFTSKKRAYRAVLDLDYLRDKERTLRFGERDSSGLLKYDEEQVNHFLNSIRIRTVNATEEWKKPTLKQYMGEKKEAGQGWKWIECHRDTINWEEWNKAMRKGMSTTSD